MADTQEETRKFAELALQITWGGKEQDKNAIFLAGLIEGYGLQWTCQYPLTPKVGAFASAD
jgi:hypothetical protein